MRASDRPRTLYAGTGTLNELVGVAVRASLAFARVSGDGRVTPVTLPIPGGEFYGAHDLCREYVQARSVALEVASTAADLPSKTGFHATADDLWRVSWFPLLRLFGKGYLAVDLGAGDETSPVHIIWHDTDRYLGEWSTVRAFVETVVYRFEEGIYAVNGDGHVEGPTIDHVSE